MRWQSHRLQSQECWGRNNDGYTNVPTSLPFARHVLCGNTHSCVLLADGTASCWQLNDYGQCDVPPTTTFASISVGEHLACGVEVNGTAHCWGRDTFEPAHLPFDQHAFGISQVPAGLLFSSVTAGGHHVCGVLLNGTALCWGRNTYNQSSPPTFAPTGAILEMTGDVPRIIFGDIAEPVCELLLDRINNRIMSTCPLQTTSLSHRRLDKERDMDTAAAPCETRYSNLKEEVGTLSARIAELEAHIDKLVPFLTSPTSTVGVA